MPTGPDEISRNVFKALRDELHRVGPLPDPEDTHPERVALFDAVEEFCCPMTIFLLHLTKEETFFGEPCTELSFVRFDMNELGTQKVDFLGELKQEQATPDHPFIRNLFFGEMDEPISKPNGVWTLGISHTPDWVARAFPHDIRVNQSAVGPDLLREVFLECQAKLIEKYDRRPNFKKIYGLGTPEFRSKEQLLRDRPFFRLDPTPWQPGGYEYLESRARGVDAIQLIPKVPEDIRRTFEMARDLYVYSAFNHYFDTVAAHYLGLAIEAAVKRRWILSLTAPITLENSKGAQELIVNPSHHGFAEFCRDKRRNGQKGWDVRELKVNGERYPLGSEDVVAALLNKRIVTKWYGRQLGHFVRLRNHYSHREFGVIMPASERQVEAAAEYLNVLFHSLP